MDRINRLLELDRKVRNLQFKRLYHLLEAENIYPGQIPILHAIFEGRGCSQRDIAQRLNISTASVAASVKRLEKLEYVLKKTDENDLRYNSVELTEEGLRVAKRAREIYYSLLEKQLDGFSEELLDQLELALTKMLDNFGTEHL